MTAVQLASNAFLPRILGVSGIFKSNSATLVAYLKQQGGTVSKVMSSLVQEIMAWTELH